MNNVLTFNRGLSAVVSKELLVEVTDIRNSMGKMVPWEKDISEKLQKLARIAKTAQLRGVHRALITLAAGSTKMATDATEDVMTHTVGLAQALMTHLQESVNDHKNAPMKMSRAIQQLNQALGLSSSPMLAAEMYLPFIPEDLSPARPTENSVEDFVDAINVHRPSYQAGLLKLIKEGDTSQLTVMRQALVTLEPKNPFRGYRVFFDAAIAVFDSLLKVPKLDNASKWVVSKIDPELNLMTQGSDRVSDDLLSAILYVTAKADHEAGARIRKLQDQYSLKSYVAELTVVDPVVIDKFLSVLVKARELWSAKLDLPYMLKITGDLTSKASFLQNAGFTIAISALHEVLNTIESQKIQVADDELSLEGASALLVLEQQLREGSNVDLAKTSASRVYKLIGKDTDAGTAPAHAGAAIIHQVAAEIQEDFVQLEPRLLEMLNEQSDGEADFRAGLVKIVKILRVFGKDNPLSVAVSTFEKTLKIEKSPQDKARIAAHYTQLSTLVEHLKTSEKAAMLAAQKWLDSMIPKEDAAPMENADIPNDKEMLEIFMEEAEGIVVDLNKWIKALKSDPSEHDTLVNARRGFHTLKGSGRMVGLSRFGDMAYISELLLNNWITSKKLASAELLTYLEDATSSVSKHIIDFKTVGTSVVEYSELENRAVALGGMPLSEAPQSKKTVRPVPTKPVQKVATTPVEVQTPEIVPVIEATPVAPVIEVPELKLEETAPVSTALTFEAPAATIVESSTPVTLSFAEPEVETPVLAIEDVSSSEVIDALPPLEATLVAATLPELPSLSSAPSEVVPAMSLDFSPEEAPVASSADLSFAIDTESPKEETPASSGLSFNLDELPDLELPAVPVAEVKEEPQPVPQPQADAPSAPVVQALDFDMPEVLKPPKAVVPSLPPLEDLKIEVPAKSPTLSLEPAPPAKPQALPSISTEEVSVTKAPIATKSAPEPAPKRKPRETPAAWQKPAERKPAAPVRREPVAPPVQVRVEPKVQEESAPVVDNTSAIQPQTSAPVAKKGLISGFFSWLGGLFSRKK